MHEDPDSIWLMHVWRHQASYRCAKKDNSTPGAKPGEAMTDHDKQMGRWVEHYPGSKIFPSHLCPGLNATTKVTIFAIFRFSYRFTNFTIFRYWFAKNLNSTIFRLRLCEIYNFLHFFVLLITSSVNRTGLPLRILQNLRKIATTVRKSQRRTRN